jgi:urease accessory protein
MPAVVITTMAAIIITAMTRKGSARESAHHLSPRGRGRPRKARAGKGVRRQIDGSAPPHPDPLPTPKPDVSDSGHSNIAEPGDSRARVERERAAPRTDTESAALYRLMAWLSPAYPIGAFSYSSGIEWAVEAGDIKNAETLRQWLAVMLCEGGGFCDAVFFVHAHRAIAAAHDQALRAVAELAATFVPSKERFLETTVQGRAFLEATRAAWPCAALTRFEGAWNGAVALPIAVGVACAGHGIACETALPAFLHGLVANWISAGVRLIPLGQTDGQRVLAALEETVAATAGRALATPLEDIGSAAFRADLATMRHETQYTRLFRS